jgi:opacity protein-like surface antigen
MRRGTRPALALACALLAGPPARAAEEPTPRELAPPPEDRAWNLSVGTGAGGLVEFADAFAGNFAVPHDEEIRRDRLQLNVRADHEQGRWFRVGLAYVYNAWTESYRSGTFPVGSVENRVHCLLLDGTLRWLRTGHVELYSALGIGAATWRQHQVTPRGTPDETSSGFAFQLRYFGIGVGNDRLRAFLDLGIGFEGLVVGGLTLRL